MKKLAAVLMLTVAVTAYAQSPKIAGSYRGPSESYGLVLEVAPDGKLRGNYVESGRVAVLNAIEVKGEKFTARASFDDGSLRVLSGSLTERGVRIGDTFFERM
ncbi:MAG TPA: hypothetical protein VND45_13935 [Thermoanaerobaculia bacterium]|nr:hypothetical protein [Thermoanaerobaculia bacterium]